MFMHTATHSPPDSPFPQSTMRQTQMLASLTHNGERQTRNWEGGVSRRGTSTVWV